MQIVNFWTWQVARLAKVEARAGLTPPLDATRRYLRTTANFAGFAGRAATRPHQIVCAERAEAGGRRLDEAERCLTLLCRDARTEVRRPIVMMAQSRAVVLQGTMALLEAGFVVVSLAYIVSLVEAAVAAAVTVIAAPLLSKVVGVVIRQWPHRPTRDRLGAGAIAAVLVALVLALALVRQMGLSAMLAEQAGRPLPTALAWLLLPLTALPVFGSLVLGYMSEDVVPGLVRATTHRDACRTAYVRAARQEALAREKDERQQLEAVELGEQQRWAYERAALLRSGSVPVARLRQVSDERDAGSFLHAAN